MVRSPLRALSWSPWSHGASSSMTCSTGVASWRASTDPMDHFLHDVTYPIVANGITFWLSDETESTRLRFKTD